MLALLAPIYNKLIQNWNYLSAVPQKRGYLTNSFATTSTTYVTALSVTGAGRLAWVYAQSGNSTNANSVKIRITIDGVVVINGLTSSDDSSGLGAYLPTYANPGFSSYRSFVPFDAQFKSTLLIEISSTVASYTSTVRYGYEV